LATQDALHPLFFHQVTPTGRCLIRRWWRMMWQVWELRTSIWGRLRLLRGDDDTVCLVLSVHHHGRRLLQGNAVPQTNHLKL